MKVEKMLKFTYDDVDMQWKFGKHTLRFIQASSVWLCATLGPYTHSMMGVLFHNLPPHLFAACGYNSVEIGEWLHSKFDAGFIYGCSVDRTNYDGSIVLAALKAEQLIFNHVAPMTKNERAAYESQFSTYGFTQFGDFYHTIGRVRSGDPNTSLGNTILSLISSDYALRNLVGLGNYCLAGQGDDLIILSKKPFDPEVYRSEQLREFGLTAKVSKLSTHPVDWEFLSSHPLPAYMPMTSNIQCGDIEKNFKVVWAMTPLIGKSLPKVYYELLSASSPEHTPLEWLRGVAVGLQTLVNHHPLYRVVNNRVLSLTEGQNAYVNDPDAKYKLQGVSGLEPHPDSMPWLSHRYGVDYPLIAALIENEVSHISSLPYRLPFCRFNIFVKRDS